MIQLSETEKRIILMCKGHYKDIYPYKGNWVITLKPLFEEIFGWSPDDFPKDYRYGLFQKLFDTFLKIQYDGSGSNRQLKELFSVAFSKGIVRNQRQSIDRVINELCGLIQYNIVLEEGSKKPRYKLN